MFFCLPRSRQHTHEEALTQTRVSFCTLDWAVRWHMSWHVSLLGMLRQAACFVLAWASFLQDVCSFCICMCVPAEKIACLRSFGSFIYDSIVGNAREAFDHLSLLALISRTTELWNRSPYAHLRTHACTAYPLIHPARPQTMKQDIHV